jgi:uncharacterized repeat protein (TIGR03806 family)
MRAVLVILSATSMWGCKPDRAEDTAQTAPVATPLAERPANPTCVAPERPPSGAAVALTPLFPGLGFAEATLAVQPPDDPASWWVLLQQGQIVRVRAGEDPQPVIDIADRADDSANEGGLLGLAFDPDWASNREVILSYTAASNPLRSTVARYRSADGGATLDRASEEVLLTVEQPYNNHNGGHVAFGHDGLLYVGFGDGGSAGDPQGNGQRFDTLLGKILRIDVHGGAPYAIPPDNPFAGGGGRAEIYAWGLRNPWRFSVDPASGDLWVGDVGQDQVEEIDIVRRGGNYGWKIMEGDRCYGATECDTTGLTLPTAVTTHDDGDRSITGGVVYTGAAIPSLQGTYLFGDYGSGRLYALIADPVSGESTVQTLLETNLAITHIGADAAGEVVIVDRNSGLYRVDPSGPPPVDRFPQVLSETGCFDPADPNVPLPMLIPYQVAHPFWSDSADKARWLAIPDGTAATVDERGELVLPVGSVAVKEFTLGTRKVETRLLVRHTDGAWAGYTYRWNDEGTEAELLAAGGEALGGAWAIPSRQQCLQCHTLATGGTLGLSLQQLDVGVAGGTERQVDQLARLGMLELPAERPDAFPALTDAASPVEDRARTWLDVNCSFCHFDGGTGGGQLDLRHDVPLAQTALCDAPQEGDLGVPGARVVTPGDPAASVLSLRIRSRDAKGMPPLGSVLVDEVGAGVVDDWIAGLTSCP